MFTAEVNYWFDYFSSAFDFISSCFLVLFAFASIKSLSEVTFSFLKHVLDLSLKVTFSYGSQAVPSSHLILLTAFIRSKFWVHSRSLNSGSNFLLKTFPPIFLAFLWIRKGNCQMELKLLLIIFRLHYDDVPFRIQVSSLPMFLSPSPLLYPCAWQHERIHSEFQAYSDWHVLCSLQHHHPLSSLLSLSTSFLSLLTLFFSSWMRLICDWHARGAPLTQLPWLLRQQPWVHLLHPDAAWQRDPATSTRLQTGGRRHAQSEGVGGVVPSRVWVNTRFLTYLLVQTSMLPSTVPLSLSGLWWQQ